MLCLSLSSHFLEPFDHLLVLSAEVVWEGGRGQRGGGCFFVFHGKIVDKRMGVG